MRWRKCFYARAMKKDVLFSIARIAMNITLKGLDVIQDYAPNVEKGIMMNGLKNYREK